MPSSGEEILRLAAVIDRQRRELDRLRGAVAIRSVLDMAKGALIERLGCSAAEATSQLAALARRGGGAGGRDSGRDHPPGPGPGGQL